MCEYCNLKPVFDNWLIGESIINIPYWAKVKIIKVNNKFMLKVSGESYVGTRIINYCPMCGRKLE